MSRVFAMTSLQQCVRCVAVLFNSFHILSGIIWHFIRWNVSKIHWIYLMHVSKDVKSLQRLFLRRFFHPPIRTFCLSYSKWSNQVFFIAS